MRYLVISLSTLTVLLSFQTIEANSIRNQKTITVYDIPKISAYDFINGKQAVFFADSSLLHSQSRMLFHIKHNWWNRNITDQKKIENKKAYDFSNNYLAARNNFIQFSGKRIAIVNELPYINSPAGHKFNVDMIILSGNPKIKIQDIQKWFEFKKIIIDSSNPSWRNEKWKKECEKLKIDFYSVIDSGAYIEDI